MTPALLDGNAVAGLLEDVFGADMTSAGATCAGCGAVAVLAELAVYARGPGTVVRCRGCGTAVMVLVTVRGTTCVDLAGLRELEPPPAAPVEAEAAR